MKRFCYRYIRKIKRIVGITLAIIGLLIIIKFIPMEAVLILIGVGLFIMGALILKIK
ncbi:hypothetical protein [Tissierella praeacuta]|uniref:hypothetical protein n=1 Tax=Tissierella praeacuta TaxID=43131 RepID=UPI0013564E1F|nr:hypothetical protein [Tissierella praeacuta]MBU5254708.1 hypothetical protein [Tissierella praeacuta]